MKEYASPVELVKVFHTTYGQPIRTSPIFDAPEKAMRHDLIDEEIDELTLAFATYDFVEVIDALADIVYVVCGAGLTHGVGLNVLIERPLVPASFPSELVSVEPFTDAQRKSLASLWEKQGFSDETPINEQFEDFRSLVKSFQGTGNEWDEISRKIADRETSVGPWFNQWLENTVSVLNKFKVANKTLHEAVHTDELKEGWIELVDLSYKASFSYGVDLDIVLEEVQASNLSKLAADGSVLRREDGKVLKGPNFFAPDIVKVLQDLIPVSA